MEVFVRTLKTKWGAM